MNHHSNIMHTSFKHHLNIIWASFKHHHFTIGPPPRDSHGPVLRSPRYQQSPCPNASGSSMQLRSLGRCVDASSTPFVHLDGLVHEGWLPNKPFKQRGIFGSIHYFHHQHIIKYLWQVKMSVIANSNRDGQIWWFPFSLGVILDRYNDEPALKPPTWISWMICFLTSGTSHKGFTSKVNTQTKHRLTMVNDSVSWWLKMADTD